ncbi:MAG: glycoside hydrolase family 16 protein [Cytophagales bacterium]|nr:glycoside hydrolase family 16 protein [Cytophagales bacterium]
MKNLALYILIFITGYRFAVAQTLNTKLVWSDEFDYTGLPDSTKWGYEEGCSIRNNELQYYTRADTANAHVRNGVLVIAAKQKSMGTCTVTSASLTTFQKYEFQYGKISIRAKVPMGTGTWPALWMMANSKIYGYWPKNGEIDIMESVGWDSNRVHCNIHTEAYNHKKGTNKGYVHTVIDLYSDFHVYELEWTQFNLIFYVDGEQVFYYEKEVNDTKVWPFDRPYYILMNLAIGGGWGGVKGVRNDIFPSKLEIDYVRVYEWVY